MCLNYGRNSSFQFGFFLFFSIFSYRVLRTCKKRYDRYCKHSRSLRHKLHLTFCFIFGSLFLFIPIPTHTCIHTHCFFSIDSISKFCDGEYEYKCELCCVRFRFMTFHSPAAAAAISFNVRARVRFEAFSVEYNTFRCYMHMNKNHNNWNGPNSRIIAGSSPFFFSLFQCSRNRCSFFCGALRRECGRGW